MRERSLRRRKSTCVGRSLTTSRCTPRQMTLLSLPSTLTLMSVDRKRPAFSCLSRMLNLTLIGCGSVAATVDDAGNESLATCAAGGPLADPCARHGFENWCLSHVALLELHGRPSSKGARPRGASIDDFRQVERGEPVGSPVAAARTERAVSTMPSMPAMSRSPSGQPLATSGDLPAHGSSDRARRQSPAWAASARLRTKARTASGGSPAPILSTMAEPTTAPSATRGDLARRPRACGCRSRRRPAGRSRP